MRPSRSQFVHGYGSRECEHLLLESIRGKLDSLAAEELIRQPLLILVPSSSLSLHLRGRIARRFGPRAGIRCSTLFAFARSLGSSRGAHGSAQHLLPLLAARQAKAEKPLERSLGDLQDGYREAVGSVRDLVDAGLTPGGQSAVEEALRAEGGAVATRAQIDRACAVVRTAARTLEQIDRQEVRLGHDDLVRARQKVIDGALDDARGRTIVFGFADATGLSADLIEVLARHLEAEVYFDRQLDPSDPGVEDPSTTFLRRLEERLGTARPAAPMPESEHGAASSSGNGDKELATDLRRPARLSWFRAPGREAEIYEVGRRVLRELDSGAPPEELALVARDARSYAPVVARQLDRLAIPFSTVADAQAIGPGTRRFAALADLLRDRDQTKLERYFEATESADQDVSPLELQTALFGLGVSRLKHWVELPIPASGLSLKCRQGFATDSDGAPYLERRKLTAAPLAEAQRRAAAVVERLSAWPRRDTLLAHARHLTRLAAEDLGWTRHLDDLQSIVLGLSRSAPRVEVSFTELAALVAETVQDCGKRPLGGSGGGVQLLDVTEARGRTWQHVFVVGLNHGSFPRTIREDPLFPDSLRTVLSREGHGLLPDLPIKSRGYDEERYLFLQLLSCAPRVTLSWLLVDDDGKPQTASPLVETLSFSGLPFRGDEQAVVPQVRSTFAPAASREADAARRGALDLALLAALDGEQRGLDTVYELALEEAGQRRPRTTEEPTSPPRSDEPVRANSRREIAGARVRVLRELDLAPGRLPGLGPYFGEIGPYRTALDPRRDNHLFVTTLEQLSRCPWKTFLVKVLRLEPLPDPLAATPEIEPRWIGNVFHRVVDAMTATSEVREPLARALERPPRAVTWPSEADLDARLRRTASEVLRQDGFPLLNLERILVALTRPHLEQLRRLDFEDPRGVPVLGSELTGSMSFAGAKGPRELYFRADRVDRTLTEVRLTDYKTSRRGPFDQLRTAKAQRSRLVRSVLEGERLQALAYLRAAGSEARARYLFVSPHVTAEPELVLSPEDEELQQAFDQAIGRALDVWMSGQLFPRLSEPGHNNEPAACDFCELAQACRRNDSGARGRVRHALARAQPQPPHLSAAWHLWWRGLEPRDAQGI